MLCIRIVSLNLFTIQDGSPGNQSTVTAEDSDQDHNVAILTNWLGTRPKNHTGRFHVRTIWNGPDNMRPKMQETES